MTVCIDRGALEIWRIIAGDGWRCIPQHEDPKRQQECDLEQEFMSWPFHLGNLEQGLVLL
jgi:hypothetical protein